MISLEIYQYEYFSIGFRGWFYYILTLTPVIHRILYFDRYPCQCQNPQPCMANIGVYYKFLILHEFKILQYLHFVSNCVKTCIKIMCQTFVTITYRSQLSEKIKARLKNLPGIASQSFLQIVIPPVKWGINSIYQCLDSLSTLQYLPLCQWRGKSPDWRRSPCLPLGRLCAALFRPPPSMWLSSDPIPKRKVKQKVKNIWNHLEIIILLTLHFQF